MFIVIAVLYLYARFVQQYPDLWMNWRRTSISDLEKKYEFNYNEWQKCKTEVETSKIQCQYRKDLQDLKDLVDVRLKECQSTLAKHQEQRVRLTPTSPPTPAPRALKPLASPASPIEINVNQNVSTANASSSPQATARANASPSLLPPVPRPGSTDRANK